jgi:hypothetical protein
VTVPHPPRPTYRRALRRFGLLVVAAAIVAACTPAPTPSIGLALDDPSISANRGETVQVTVDLTRSGAADAPVALDISGLPANVTATFAPDTLTGSASESTLTLTVASAAAEGISDLTITATAGSLTTDTELTLDITSLTIQGRLEGAVGRPIVGATVSSQGATTFSDASGEFTLSGLALPYDLAVSAALGDGFLHVYEGLTSATPLVRPALANFMFVAPNFSADVQGTVVGGPLGAGEVVRVCVEGLAVAVYGCDSISSPAADYTIGAEWFDGPNTAVRLHALHMQVGVDGLPTAYLGYETILLNLTDGGVTLADLDFDPIGSAVLTGTTTFPAGITDTASIGFARFGPNLSFPVFQDDDVGATFGYLVPVLPNVSYDVLVGATGGPISDTYTWKSGVGLDAGAFVIGTAPQPVAPADGATGVDLTTPFGSTAVGGARTYLWFPDGAGPLIALTTTRTSVSVPDPAVGGFAFPAGAVYEWGVLNHGDADMVDAAAGGYADFLNITVSFGGIGGPGVEGNRTVSIPTSGRAFTFEP